MAKNPRLVNDEIEKMIDEMTIDELKAAAKVGLSVTIDLLMKTQATIMKMVKELQ